LKFIIQGDDFRVVALNYDVSIVANFNKVGDIEIVLWVLEGTEIAHF